MANNPSGGDTVLSCLPANLSAELFGKGRSVALAANEVLFLAGDPGDGCYRVESGLLKAAVYRPPAPSESSASSGPGRFSAS